MGLICTGEIKKALLLVGDAKGRAEGPDDPLFGDAGTATAVEYSEGAKDFCFHFGTDGSGYDAIITPDGGSRNQVSPKSFEYEEIEGKMYHRMMTRMNGMDVFSFAISTASANVLFSKKTTPSLFCAFKSEMSVHANAMTHVKNVLFI